MQNVHVLVHFLESVPADIRVRLANSIRKSGHRALP